MSEVMVTVVSLAELERLQSIRDAAAAFIKAIDEESGDLMGLGQDFYACEARLRVLLATP